jgi:hypothetical protein
MAKSFYKYAERESDSFVNWAEIGKGMSDMLAETNRVREEKKAAIDQASRDFQNKLNNVPTGQDASARREALAYADNASKFMLMQDRLLKSGRMKLKDYTIGRQNILDDTDRIFDTMSKYQTQYGERMQRYKDGKSSIGELKNMEKVEGFGNWEKSGTYINPETGRVVMAMKEEQIVDGKKVYTMSTNPNQFASISHLDGLMGEYWDKFDVAKATDEWSSKLGKEMTSLSIKAASLVSQGQIRTTDDITKRKDLSEDEKTVLFDFFDAETQYIKASLNNPFDRASTLLDYVGQASNKQAYFFTQDRNEAKNNPAAILEVIDPVTQRSTYEFNEEQNKESQEYVRKIARSKYNREDSIQSTSQLSDQTYRPPAITSTQKEINDENDLALNFSRQTSYLTSGTDAQKAEAVAYFRGKGANIISAADGIYIENKNGEMVQFKPKSDTKSFGSSIVGPLLKATETTLPDTKVVKYFSKFMGPQFNTTAAGTGMAEQRDVNKEFEVKVVKKIEPVIFEGSDKETATSALLQIFEDVSGIEIIPSKTPFVNNIKIVYTNPVTKAKSEITVNANENSKKAVTQSINLKKFIRDIDEESKAPAIGEETSSRIGGY